MTGTAEGTCGFSVRAAYCKRPAQRNFNRRLLAATAAAILLGGAGGAARSGPCTAQIEKIERQIGSDVAGPTFGLTAPQSVDAQVHRQPTPNSVEHAKHVANTDGDVAINRAIRANAAGDGTRCSQELGAAQRFYNIKQ